MVEASLIFGVWPQHTAYRPRGGHTRTCFFGKSQLQSLEKASYSPLALSRGRDSVGTLRDRPQSAGSLPATEAESVGRLRRPISWLGGSCGEPYGAGRGAFAWRLPIATISVRSFLWRSSRAIFALLRNFRGKSKSGHVSDGGRPANRCSELLSRCRRLN